MRLFLGGGCMTFSGEVVDFLRGEVATSLQFTEYDIYFVVIS